MGLRGAEGVRLFYGAQQRLFRAWKRGVLTEDEFRARQRAIVDWLAERRIHTSVPDDAVLARGGTPVVVPLDADGD